MLLETPVLTRDVRDSLIKRVDELFRYNEGSDLQSVVDEVLHDRNIFTYFACYVRYNQGLALGCTRFWDDINVDEHYGLSLCPDVPRRLKIFNYEVTDPFFPNQNIEVFFGYEIRSFNKTLLPETFVSQVNEALRDPEKHLIEFKAPFVIKES